MADIFIQGGEVLDPGQGLRGRLDIAVSQGKITQIALHIDPREAQRVVDVSGEVVVPASSTCMLMCMPASVLYTPLRGAMGKQEAHRPVDWLLADRL
jgi:hypothetical protein